MSNIVVLGDGILGSEIIKETKWDYISRSKDNFDITNESCFEGFFLYKGAPIWDTIVNCIANTDTYSSGKELHWDVNYKAVYNLVTFCNEWNIKLVHISSDFVYSNSFKEKRSELDVPVHFCNWYSYTKLLADSVIELLSNNYLICRCTHQVSPFKYEKAFINRIGNFDYVSKISELIIKLINNDSSGIFNVGTNLKTMYELAKQTKNNVTPTMCKEDYPKDTSMDINKLKIELKNLK